jgi:hypothetical protein
MPTRKPRKKSGGRRYGNAASKSVESAMRRRKRGTLKSGKSGHGGKVTSRKQAIAIGLSEARKKGAKVPSRSSSSRSPRGGSRRGTSSRSSHRST